jgi:hypothetical protein
MAVVTMDINTLISRFHNTFISNKENITITIQVQLKIIIDSITQRCEEGCNSFTYEIITMDDSNIKKIRNELLLVFPEMEIIIKDKQIIIDWS